MRAIDGSGKWIYAVIIIYFPPACISYIEQASALDSVFTIGRYLLFAYILCVWLMDMWMRAQIRNAFLILTAILFGMMVFATIQNHSFYLTSGTYFLTILGMLLLHSRLYQKDRNDLLKAYQRVMGLYLLIHFATLWLFPAGMVPELTGDGRIYFLGGKNTVATYLLIYLLCSLVLWAEGGFQKKWPMVIRFLALDVFVWKNDSSTLLIVLAVCEILVFLWLILKCSFSRTTRPLLRFCWGCVLVISVAFLCFAVISGKSTSVVEMMAATVGKTATFSGRTDIWEAAISYINDHALWGVGYDASYDVWNNDVIVYSAHNTILDCGVKYGCLVLAMYLFLWFVIFAKLWQTRRNDTHIALLGIGILLFVVMLFEAVENMYTTWLLMLFMYLYADKEVCALRWRW